jgi:Holliday junction resolvasome RuvABC DNA-binding subunit
MVIMTNEAAIGYAILALKELGYSEEEIRKIEKEMLYFMDMKTEEEAHEVYRKF